MEHSTIAAARRPNLEVVQKQLTIVTKKDVIPKIPKKTCARDSDRAMIAKITAAVI